MGNSVTFGVMYLRIAFGLTCAFTGGVAVDGAITLVSPVANTAAAYFFDHWWKRRTRPLAAVPAPKNRPRPAPKSEKAARRPLC